MNMTLPIRVLIIDDSVAVRRAVADALEPEPGIEVAATAANGQIGLTKIATVHPDVVTLDVEMPVLDGLATLRAIREKWPVLPVIMFSTLTEEGASTTLEALALGASDFATKPTHPRDRADATAQLRDSLVPLIRLWGGGSAKPASKATIRRQESASAGLSARSLLRAVAGSTFVPRLVVIGVSTGGPDALAELIPALPATMPVPVLIVQHMPPVFTGMLAKRLDQRSLVMVSEASDGDLALAGHVYIAPGGMHLQVHAHGPDLRLNTDDGPPENSCRPSADVLFRSAVEAAGSALVTVVLTGMGQDGRLGAARAAAAGGVVIAQDEATSVVWGMPGFVARDGVATDVLALPQIAPAIVTLSSPARPAVATVPAAAQRIGTTR